MSKLALFILAFAATASIAVAAPTREQYLTSFPRESAIAIRFGPSTSESFVVVDLGEPFSRRTIRNLFLEGPEKLQGTIYLSIYTAPWTGDLARRAAEYIYCGAGGDQISRLKEAAQEGFQPKPIQGHCKLKAVEKNSRTKLDGLPAAFVGDRFVAGSPSIQQLATAESAARSTQQAVNARQPQDKGAINPPGRATFNCPQSIEVIDEQQQRTITYTYTDNGFVLFSDSYGRKLERWGSIESALAIFTQNEEIAREKAKNPTSCTGLNAFGQPAPCPKVYPPADYSRAIEWAQCHRKALNASAGSSGSQNSKSLPEDDIDIVTPSVPGCPKYLRKSLVEWTRKPGSNPQLNVWQVKNVSKKILKVTYRFNGANNDSGTLNPGDTSEVWQISEPPPYVVRDFEEIMAFNQIKANNRKSLQCELAIRPR